MELGDRKDRLESKRTEVTERVIRERYAGEEKEGKCQGIAR